MQQTRYTLDEVREHQQDGWMVIEGGVYDVTDLLASHPGGKNILIKHFGKDATKNFHRAGHSSRARGQMAEYLIGSLAGGPLHLVCLCFLGKK